MPTKTDKKEKTTKAEAQEKAVEAVKVEEESPEEIDSILKERSEELKALEARKKEEEKKAREAEIARRKEEGALHAAGEKKVQVRKKPRHGKKYREIEKVYEKDQVYRLEEGLELVKKLSLAKFDASIDSHIRLEDANVRGLVNLPYGTGKTIRVAIVDDSVLEKIEKGAFDFDLLVASPDKMPQLAKLAKILGPKGLMPSPKSGTVSTDPEKTKQELESGKIEYRADSLKIVHQPIGRVSWEVGKLAENLKTLIQTLQAHKIHSIFLAPSMGPSVKVKIWQSANPFAILIQARETRFRLNKRIKFASSGGFSKK